VQKIIIRLLDHVDNSTSFLPMFILFAIIAAPIVLTGLQLFYSQGYYYFTLRVTTILLSGLLLFYSQGYYYFAIIEDLILRFAWTITVTIGEGEVINSEVLRTVVASLEVFRLFNTSIISF